MLRKREVGETDRLYTFFSREQGKVTAIAKGVRKVEAKLASSLETATLAEIMVARAQGIGKITGAVLEQAYPALHGSYEALRDVTRFVSVVDRLVEPEEKDEQLFEFLKQYLETIEMLAISGRLTYGSHLVTEAAHFRLFEHLGYRLELGCCVVSGKSLQPGGKFFLSFEAGGIVSALRVQDVRDAQPISESTIKSMRMFLAQPLSQVPKIILGDQVLAEISRIRNAYRLWIRT